MLRSTFLAGASAMALVGATNPYADIEAKYRGKLGVEALDLYSGATLAHRRDERFPLASTFKLPMAAAVLARDDAGPEHRLPLTLEVTRKDLLDYSPVVDEELGNKRAIEMPLDQLCAAAIEESDNTAALVVLRALGGPAALNAYLRSIGDRVTHIAHGEPTINAAAYGDASDTTTPAAMAELTHKLVLGRLLSSPNTSKLLRWMRACKTGADRLRAGVPRAWSVADKTGTTRMATNDVGILFVPTGPPIVVAAYLYGGPTGSADRSAAIAEVARETVRIFHRNAKRA